MFLKFLPGTTSKDCVHYIKPTLQENEFDTSVLHMGINDVLTVSKDIINIANRCKNSVLKQIIISGLVLVTCFNASFMHHLNNSVKVLCQKHGYSFIDNSNVSSANLWQEGLHLNNSGKGILLNYYVLTLNDSYFLVSSFTQ